MGSMIEVKNLTKSFKTTKKYPGFKGAVKSLFTNEKVIKTAVSKLSFSIDEGEIVGYIGANGAGKSTTIKMMTGILVPTSGSCTVNGILPYKERKKNAKNIGVVFGQRTQLWWDLPLTETFSILKGIYQVQDADYRKRIDFIYEVLGIKEFELSTVRTLSLGQRMRADLGAALIHNPKVLYLDEPTIGLDVLVKDKIRDAIRQINKEYNTTVVLTTHDLSDIESLCRHIIIIDQGKKIYDGNSDDLKERFGAKRTITLAINDVNNFNKVDYNQMFGLPENELSVAIEENNLIVSFVKDKISASKIASGIIALGDVGDMTIEEPDLNSIVKEIYMNGGK